VKYSSREFTFAVLDYFLVKSNKGLKEWMINKNIELEVNYLMNIRYTNVGMFIECHPHEPLFHIHECMLQQLLPPQSPELKMKVWMVYNTDKQNKDKKKNKKEKNKDKYKKSCKVLLILEQRDLMN
jgi:hypothetical protein